MTFNPQQFFDFSKNFTNQEQLFNMYKNIPGMDFSTFTEIAKRNTEALSSLHQKAFANAKDMTKNHAEIFQFGAAHGGCNPFKAADNSSNNAQQQYLQAACDHFVHNAKEVINLAAQSSIEMIETMGKNFTECINKINESAKG